MSRSGPRKVEYAEDEIARRYAGGRALGDDVLGRWRLAVSEWLPRDTPLRILDLGAGTGIFARVWPDWCACQVVAVEPSRAMRNQMVRDGVGAGVHVVGASAPLLPLRNRSIDVAWLSTVIHHLDDLPAAASELERVLAAGGTLLIRGLFADRGHVAGLSYIPGSERALSSYPSTAAVVSVLQSAGFQLLRCSEVQDAGPSTVSEAAQRIRRLHRADTLLGRFTEDELSAGLDALERCDPDQLLDPTTLALLALAAP